MSETSAIPITFGTYRLTDSAILDLAVRQAIDHGVALIDTAPLYHNEEAVAKICRETNTKAGTKLRKRSTLEKDLHAALSLFGPSLERVLLHKPMPYAAYQVLEDAHSRGQLKQIGVCNISATQLEELLAVCRVKPHVIQNELHAAISTPVVDICKRENIVFEAHSVFAANDLLAPIAASLTNGPTPAALAILHAKARGAHALCLTTTKVEHLAEDLAVAATAEPAARLLALGTQVAEALDQLPKTNPRHKYGLQDDELPSCLHPQRLSTALATLRADVASFERGDPTSTLCLALPKLTRKASEKRPNDQLQLARALAAELFGEGHAASTRFDHLMTKMRKAVHERDAVLKAEAAPKTCKIGPTDAIANPTELPVDIPDGLRFEPLLAALAQAQAPLARLTQAGAITPDGRLDLCKQVVQPRFAELVRAVRSAAPGVVSHFLIGNNIVFKGSVHGVDGVSANLAAFEQLAASVQPIKTFYLAGNGIDAAASASIAAALQKAHALEGLYLKMNPIGVGALHFGHLAAVSPTLKVLDLFNTGLLDAGLQAFANGLQAAASACNSTPALQHLYLNINGLTPSALPPLRTIAALLPKLESLYIGENSLGDDAIVELLSTLSLPHLARLEIGSNELTDAVLPALVAFVAKHQPKLGSLDLSSYKSTHFFRLKPNLFGASKLGLSQLIRLAAMLSYLGLDNALPSQAVAAELLPLLDGKCSVNARQRRAPYEEKADAENSALPNAQPQAGSAPDEGRGKAATFSKLLHSAEELQVLRHPAELQHIFSIYRNKM